jgi:hypothetical protein
VVKSGKFLLLLQVVLIFATGIRTRNFQSEHRQQRSRLREYQTDTDSEYHEKYFGVNEREMAVCLYC